MVTCMAVPRAGLGAQGNTPGVLNEATADMALTLMLAAARRLPETDAYCKTGQWERDEHMSLVGQDVTGSTCSSQSLVPPSVRVSVCLSARLSACLFLCLSVLHIYWSEQVPSESLA